MIIRSGLIRNRDGIDFEQFTQHWKNVHGPLALRVGGMRGYNQNHIRERIPSAGADALHRIDGISQLWFDDLEAMKASMDSPEQRACVADIRGFLSDVTIVVQQEGSIRSFGGSEVLPVKLFYLLRGEAEALADVEAGVSRFLSGVLVPGSRMRFNPVAAHDVAVDVSVSSGPQVVDAVLEIWLPDTPAAAVFTAARAVEESAAVSVVGAYKVDEFVLLDRDIAI